MSAAERFGWTADDIVVRRALAKAGEHVTGQKGTVEQVNIRRARQAKIVFCAAALANQLERGIPTTRKVEPREGDIESWLEHDHAIYGW